jgi:hypothetical protein
MHVSRQNEIWKCVGTLIVVSGVGIFTDPSAPN